MKKLLALCSLACTLALPLSASAQEDYPPGEVHLAPTIDLDLQPVPIEGMPGRTLNLPPGFKVKLFSDQVNKARFMAFDDNGVLHLTNMHTNGSNQWSPDPNRTSDVLAFLDFDNDGHADSVYVAANDFLWPHSIAFYKSQLYVADHDIIYRLTDNDGDGFYEGRENFIEVPGIMGRASEHITHTLVFDEENEKLYLHAGSGCDLCREDDPERATILEFNADGTGRRIYASGLRNAIGLDLHPVTGELWAAGNGHDREGAALPPEWINVIPENSFHGWPLAFGYQKWVDFSISRYRSEIFPLTAQDSALVASIRRPVALVPAHLAPMGLHFYTHNQFPSQYKNAAFVAFRAGVLGNDPGYKVSVLFSEPDGSNARIGDFLTGFRPNPQTNDFWGTPVGLITDDKGFLYLTSDRFTQAIFRIEAVPGPDNPTAVEEASQNSAPASFALEANYPNPFNASTTLRYRLDAAGPVRLDIYSLSGQKVQTLVDDAQQAGFYSVEWNGKDAGGNSVASGVYLARLEGRGTAQVHKMLLLK